MNNYNVKIVMIELDLPNFGKELFCNSEMHAVKECCYTELGELRIGIATLSLACLYTSITRNVRTKYARKS